MRFSRELVRGNPSIVVITNEFHIYMGTRFAVMAGFEDVTSFHAAIFKMWVLGT